MSNLLYIKPERVYDPETSQLFIQVVLIGEAPGQTEESELRPFVGRSGQLLRKALSDLGVECYYLTNAVKVRPEGNRKPTKAEIETWAPLLEEELLQILDAGHQPVIVALGESADWAMKCMDTNFTYHKLWHPAYVLRFGKHKEYRETLKKVMKLSD